MKRSLLAITLVALLTACGSTPTQDKTKGWSASKFYSEARAELAEGNYDKVAKLLEQLESRYPFGRYAQQAQLELVYVYYKKGEIEQTLAAADRFIRLHPNHPNVDYAYYLKGLANFIDDRSLFRLVSSQDPTERDPKAARESFEAFKLLVARYPESKYAEDAAARMTYLLNSLASGEVHVARYYFKRGAFVAVVNRAQYALQSYPQAPANEEALALMVRAYNEMGMADLRDDALRVLEKNFPSSKYLRGREEDPAWWMFWKLI
jgi:outer membrane protein assembly factor BamD